MRDLRCATIVAIVLGLTGTGRAHVGLGFLVVSAEMNLDSLSIIIVSWNTRQLLEKCLESILSNPSCSPSDIWVVNNHSTDESPTMVRERFSTVHLIENSVNVGFARANNQAIEQCTGKYILMLNPDTMVEAYALEVLVNFLQENPAAGAVGAKLLNPDGSMQVSSYPWPTIPREILRMFYLNRIFPYTEYPQTKWKTDVAQEVDVIIGACLLVRREVFFPDPRPNRRPYPSVHPIRGLPLQARWIALLCHPLSR